MTVQLWFEHHLPFVLLAAVAVSCIVGLAFLIAESRSPSTAGRGGLDVGDRVPAAEPRPLSETEEARIEEARRERTTEIRQLLGAISDLRVGRGQPAIDIEPEVVRLARCAELDPRALAQTALFPLATVAPRATQPRRARRARVAAGRSGRLGPGEEAA
jgi:hypothetical protein